MNSNSTIPVKPRPYLMQNQIQPYAWGTRDDEAFIPRLLGIEPGPGLPYAELWMGVHPKAPSKIVVEGATVSLDQWIAAYSVEILGEAVAEQFSGTLPFLFKVLSAGESLSIQAHPNKAQAEALHACDPEHYPDDNHKPELAVALDSLTALVGIKPFHGIIDALDRYPELANFIGQETCNKLRNAKLPSYPEQRELARIIFSTLIKHSINCEKELIQSIDKLAKRLSGSSNTLSEEEQIFLNLRKKYLGADVGLFAIFWLNLIHLEEGQGIFIEAGIPHAYLKGNIVECMANSDNVVRIGLTPKFKDAKTLINILNYQPRPPSILEGSSGLKEVIYQTPALEFQVSRWEMKSDTERSEVTGNRPEVLLITKGDILISWDAGPESRRETFQQGQSILIPALLEKFRVRAKSPAELFKVGIPFKATAHCLE